MAGSLLSSPPAIAGTPTVRAVTVAMLHDPVGFTFTPNGRIVYVERGSGEVRFLNPATDRDRLFFRIGGVDSEGERGALGVALHPEWPRKPFVYVYVTRGPGSKPLENQLVRLRAVDGRGRGLKVLLRSPVGSRTNHNGGRIVFGPDGMLYVVIGDGGEDPATAQDLTDEPRGKVLRINPSGTVPSSNPFPGSRVFSYGHRNSIGLGFDPETGSLWETENGPECNDEINLIAPGGNFGWGPMQACPDTNVDGPAPIAPVHILVEPVAVTGLAFCDRCGLGAAYDGDLFAGCANGSCKLTVGPVAHADLTTARDDFDGALLQVPLQGFDKPVYSLEVAPSRRLYFSNAEGIYRLAPA